MTRHIILGYLDESFLFDVPQDQEALGVYPHIGEPYSGIAYSSKPHYSRLIKNSQQQLIVYYVALIVKFHFILSETHLLFRNNVDMLHSVQRDSFDSVNDERSMKILLVRLQHYGPMNRCDLMDDDHDLHVCIIHGPGQVRFDGGRETREAGMIISGNRHEIEAMRSLPQAPSGAERLVPASLWSRHTKELGREDAGSLDNSPSVRTRTWPLCRDHRNHHLHSAV